MINFRFYSIVVVWLVLCQTALAEIAIIAHPSSNISNVNVDSIKRVYTGKDSELQGVKVKPYNQAATSDIANQFNKNVLGKTSAQVKAYWSKLIFTGKGRPPEEVDSDAAMLQKVSSDVNAIGYVDSAAVNGNVKVLLKM